MRMSFDMDSLYPDDADTGDSLYGDDAGITPVLPDTILYRDRVIVQPMKPVTGVHGTTVIPDGEPSWCLCDIEGRTQKNSTFSKNWKQDMTSSPRGQLETTLLRIMAKEWHGDYYSRVWYEGDCYECDGSPVEMPHGTDMSRHWEIVVRMVTNHLFSDLEEPKPTEGSRVWGT